MLPYYDIDEMRASGYCPSTIEAAETYNARWDALFASPIGQYLREGTPEEVILVSGVRLLPLAEVVERTRELAPDKILFDEGFAPIASSIEGNCLAYDPRTRAFYRAEHCCVSGTGYLLTPGDHEELPYSPANLRKAPILVSQDPPDRFIADLRAGVYEEQLDDSLLVEEKTIHHPLFGKLEWDSSVQAWGGRVRLAFFVGYDFPGAAFPSRRSRLCGLAKRIRFLSLLGLRLKRMMLPITLYDVTGQGPSAEQENALIYLQENETAVGQAIVQGILSCYQDDVYDPLQKRKMYLKESRKMVRQDSSSAEKELEEFSPKLESPEGLKRLICLHELYFEGSPCEEPQGGFARIGWSFACTWDEEHGLGVRTHKDIVEEVGTDDAAFCL